MEYCPHLREGLAKFCRESGLDCKDVHDVTAYGKKLEPYQGVLIVRATIDKEAARNKVEKAPQHDSFKYGDHEIHTWIKHHGPHAHLVAATLYKPDVLVLASSVGRLQSALDVLDGKEVSLDGKDTPLAAKPPEGAMFLARAVGVDKVPAAKHRPVLASIERFSYAEGQHGERWFGRIDVATDSKQSAEQIEDVGEGFVALASLCFRGESAVVDTLKKIKITADGQTVNLAFDESASTLAERAPAICKALHDHFARHAEMWKKHDKPHRHHLQ